MEVMLLCERERKEKEKGGYEGKKRIEDTKEEDKEQKAKMHSGDKESLE